MNDQTAGMCRLVCAFVAFKQHSQGFSRPGSDDVEGKTPEVFIIP